MMNIIVFCSQLTKLNWLQDHLISCPFKLITGIDCPGCGFQRSVIQLIKGNLHQSLLLYPATIPLLLTTIFVFADMRLHFDKTGMMKKVIYMITGNIIVFAYLFKVYKTYL